MLLFITSNAMKLLVIQKKTTNYPALFEMGCFVMETFDLSN